MKWDKWFNDFCRAYIAYLIRLPSISDIYQKIGTKLQDMDSTRHLTYLFRLTNHIRGLLPVALNAVNTIGRYQASAYIEMRELFNVLSREIV